MRQQITLFQDQYEFYKELKSKKLLIAFVEYMFEDIEPTDLKGVEKVAFNSLRIRMDNQKNKSKAGQTSHGGGRPSKTSGELGSENNRKTTEQTTTRTTEKQEDIRYKNKDKEEDKVKDKEEDKVKDKENIKNNKLSLIPKSNDFEPKEITTRINDLISELKQTAKGLGIAYDNKDERMFSKHILTAKAFNEFAMNINQEPTQFAINIMKASVMINYWKGPCSGPKLIYQNYAEVFNKTQQQAQKSSKNLIQEF